MLKRKIFVYLICVVLAISVHLFCIGTSASGTDEKNAEQALKTTSPQQDVSGVTAKSFILVEMQTGKILYERQADTVFRSLHFNKLMTLLLLCEKIQGGDIDLNDTFTVSNRANSCKDPQIWLEINEKISVDELVKAITVGNANDAAVTIAEGVSGSEQRFVENMNAKARSLGMGKTVYADCTGTDPANVTTAGDLSKLCTKLEKYDFLAPYLKTWLTTVRNGKAELVNNNTLVRTYGGVSGMKAFSSDKIGSCGCVTADKNGMKLCAVVFGCADKQKRDNDIKKLFKAASEEFQTFVPKVPEKLLENIPVTGGEKLECELELENQPLVIIKRGISPQLKEVSQTSETLTAPVRKGQVCVQYTLEYNNSPVCTVNIVAKDNIEKMNWLMGVKKLIYNLLKL